MRAVFFDIGSTLVSGPATGPATRLAAPLGLDPARKYRLQNALMTRPFKTAREVAQFVAPEFGLDASFAEDAISAIWLAQETEAVPIAGARDCLRDWASAGVQLGLISNIWQPYLASVLRHYSDIFDEAVPVANRLFSFEVGEAKPSAVMFREALKVIGCRPDEILIVGDSYREDIEAAANLGMRTAWVLHRPDEERDNLARILNGQAQPPDITIRAIEDLRPLPTRHMLDSSSVRSGIVTSRTRRAAG